MPWKVPPVACCVRVFSSSVWLHSNSIVLHRSASPSLLPSVAKGSGQMAQCADNKIEFVPVAAQGQLMPFDWRTLGAVFALGDGKGKDGKPLAAIKLSGRCAATLTEGFDPIDASSTGRVLDGRGDAGITLRTGSTALSLTACNFSLHTGLDDPLAAAQSTVGESSVPSVKLTLAKEYSEDSFAAVSFDIAQKKPEVSVGWSGSTLTEQAAVVVHADPVYRTYKLAACVAFPGPEWREVVLDRTAGVLVHPADDGARHRLWAQHTIKDRQWGYRTRVGCAIDLGRMLNWAAELIDNKVEPRIPPLIWSVPFLHKAYDLLIPAQDAEQVRYHMKGWDLEAAHEFGHQGSQLGVAKHMRFATLRGTWHTGSQEAGLQYSRRRSRWLRWLRCHGPLLQAVSPDSNATNGTLTVHGVVAAHAFLRDTSFVKSTLPLRCMDTQEELMAEEEEVDDEEVQQQQEEEPQQRTARPNQQFLARMLHGVTRGNQRVIDTNNSRAARKAVGASGAASLRPVLNRAVKQGPAAVRRAALTAAQQQKMTLCTSLLREVAMTFGFKLHVHGHDGTLLRTSSCGDVLPSTAAAAGSTQPTAGAADKQAAEHLQQSAVGPTTENGEGHQECGPPTGSPQAVALEELHVSLLLAQQDEEGEEDWEGAGDEQGLKPVGKISRGTALLAGAGQGTRVVARPRIALGSLEGLSTTLRRASASAGTSPTGTSGMGAAAVLMQAARRRALARQASQKSQPGSDDQAAEPEDHRHEQQADVGIGVGSKARSLSSELAGDGPMMQTEHDSDGQQAAAPASRAGKARIVWQPAAGAAADAACGKSEAGDGSRTPLGTRTAAAAAAAAATPASAPAAATAAGGAARRAPLAHLLSTAMDAAAASVTGKPSGHGGKAASGAVDSATQAAGSASEPAAGKQRAAAHAVTGRTSTDSMLGTSASDAALKDSGIGTAAAAATATPAVRSLSTAALRSAGLVGASNTPSTALQGESQPAAEGAATVSQPAGVSSSVKRPPASTLNGLFSAAMRDLKKVKQVVGDEGS